MKFFSLIHEPTQEVHLAQNVKHLPQEAFSKLLDAHNLLETTKADTIEYQKKASQEGEVVKQRAAEDGFVEGLNQWAEQVFKVEDEVHKIKKELEKVMIKAALMAGKRIVGREIEQNPKTIVDIIRHSLKAVAQHQKINIYCNKEDYQALEAARPELKSLFEQLEALAVLVKDDLERGAYVIETERGIINHSNIDEVWQAMEQAFESTLSQQGQGESV